MSTPLGQILGRAGAWLLDLTIGGRVVRVTTAPGGAAVTSSALGSLRYVGGLSDLSLPRSGGRLRSVSVELTVTPPDFAELQARGQRLDFGSAVVRRWYEGQTYEQARVYAIGRIVGVQYGSTDEPFSFTIIPDANEAGTIPAPDMVVDSVTFSTRGTHEPDPNIVGTFYPIVVGTPGVFEGLDNSALQTPATPGLLCEWAAGAVDSWTSRIMVAGHLVSAGTVTLHDLSAETSATATVSSGFDNLGRAFSYVQMDAVTGFVVGAVAGHDYGVSWTSGGGALDDDGTVLRGAGRVIAWLLRRWTRPGFRFDAARQSAQVGALDAYLLDFAITSPTDPLAWIRQHLVSILPIEEVEGPDGIYFRALRTAVRPGDAVGHIDCSPAGPVTRASRLASDASTIANRITLSYAMGGPQRRHLKRIVADASQASPSDPDTTDARGVPLWLCEWSQGLFGVRDLDVQTGVIGDDATANAVLSWLVRKYAVPRRRLQVVGDVTLDRYEPGDVVTVTASDLYLSGALAVVVEVEALDTAASLVLELDDDPATTTRRTV